MAKPPNLRILEHDITNPDLDKRYVPNNSCLNCQYAEMWDNCSIDNYPIKWKDGKLQYAPRADYWGYYDVGNMISLQLSIKCNQSNFICKNDCINVGNPFLICDDHVSKDYIKKEIYKKKHNIEGDINYQATKGLGWKAFGMWWIYMMIFPILWGIPMMLLFPEPNIYTQIENLIVFGTMIPIVYILPILMARRWYKKKINQLTS